MKAPPIVTGIVCAFWTPLDSQGRVDRGRAERHLEWLVDAGLDGLLILGSTGRFPLLPVSAREEFIRAILPRAGALPCLVNVSDLEQTGVARLGRAAAESGAGGVAIMTPWYYEQAQADLVEWFVAAGTAAALPLWLYNFPERTGNRIELGTVREVRERVPLGGFKNSGANQDLLPELAKLARSRPFAVFAGADAHIPEALARGAVGCIGGLANVVPEAMLRVHRATATGNPAAAARDLELLREIDRRMHLVPFPINIAAAMEARGIDPGALPATLSRVTRAHYEQLKSEVRGLLEAHAVPPR